MSQLVQDSRCRVLSVRLDGRFKRGFYYDQRRVWSDLFSAFMNSLTTIAKISNLATT